MTKYAHIINDSKPANLLTVPAGGGRIPLDPVIILNGDRYIHMVGLEVYKNAVKAIEEAGVAALKQTGLTGDNISLMIPHQANSRIIDSTTKWLAMPSVSLGFRNSGVLNEGVSFSRTGITVCRNGTGFI